MIRQILIATLLGLALAAPADKVCPKLKSVLSTKGQANIVVIFNRDTDAVLNRVNSLRHANRAAKITTMKTQLEALQQETQSAAISILSERSASFHALWINNRIYVDAADMAIVQELAALPEVTEVREELVLQLEEPIFTNNTINAEWGIDKIQAQQAWALPGGNNGAGVVVSAIDTGVRGTHQALRNNMRASYNWFDPYSSTSNPTDNNGHGTHVMGTIAGSGGIGVAPGAQWIACRGCSNTGCTESALTRCGQWVACPTLANGNSPNCNMAPALSSNSWGGSGGQTFYNAVINAWHTAGIVPVFAISNSGPSCRTAGSPGDSTNVIGVGSTTSSDSISSFSSRGPTLAGAVKPDISAPGSDVRSSWYTSDTAYNTISGTSMATPHVSGVIALLLSRNGNLSYNQVKNLLTSNTDRNLGAAATCGNTPPTQWPNNIYGWGRLNARSSLAAAINGF